MSLPKVVPNLVVGQRTVNLTEQHIAFVGQYQAAPGDRHRFVFPKSRKNASEPRSHPANGP